jgi:hypothetical protein
MPSSEPLHFNRYRGHPLKGKSREKTLVHAKKMNSFSLDAYENTSSVSFSTPIRTSHPSVKQQGHILNNTLEIK